MAPYNPVNSAYRPSRPNQPMFAVRPNPVYNPVPNNPPVKPSNLQPQPAAQPRAVQQFGAKIQQVYQVTAPPPPTQTTAQTTAQTTSASTPQVIVGGENANYVRQGFRFGNFQDFDSGIEPGQYRYLDEDEEEQLRAVEQPLLPMTTITNQPLLTTQQQSQVNDLNQLIQSGLKKACNLSTTSVFDKNKYPWIVSIGSITEKHIKTGVLIHPRWVLTVQDYMNVGIKNYIVKIGGVNLDNNSEFSIYSVINDVVHPSNRIQLLQLNSDVTSIPPIQINMNNVLKPPAIEIGWGTLSGSNKTYTLHEMIIPILNPEVCKTVFQHKFIDELNICGGYPECQNLIPCIGDTGDPLVFLDNNKFVLEAISEYHLNCEVRSGLGSWIKINKMIPWLIQYIPDLLTQSFKTQSPTPTQSFTPTPTQSFTPTPFTNSPIPIPTQSFTPTAQQVPIFRQGDVKIDNAVQTLLDYVTKQNTDRSVIVEQEKSSGFTFDSRYVIITFIIILFTLLFVVMIINLTR